MLVHFATLFLFWTENGQLDIFFSNPPQGVNILEINPDDPRFLEGMYPLQNY